MSSIESDDACAAIAGILPLRVLKTCKKCSLGQLCLTFPNVRLRTGECASNKHVYSLKVDATEERRNFNHLIVSR